MNQTRNSLLVSFGSWAAAGRWKATAVAVLLTVAALFGIARLDIDLTYLSIMPRYSQQTVELRRIVNEFPAASPLIVVVEGGEPDALRMAVDAIETELSSEPYADIVYGIRGRASFEQLSGKLFHLAAEHPEIERLTDFSSPVEMLAAVNGMVNRILDTSRITSLQRRKLLREVEALHAFVDTLLAPDESARLDSFSNWMGTILEPEPYLIDETQSMALIIIQPEPSFQDWRARIEGTERIEQGIAQYEQRYGVTIGLTGLTAAARDQFMTARRGFLFSSLAAGAAVVLLLIFGFRMRSVPLAVGIPLVLGIVWTAGAAGFLVGRLTIITGVYALVLFAFGMGMAVQYINAFYQERETGCDFSESLVQGIRKSGRSIAGGALTAAVAFFSQIAARSDMLRELAVVAGIGMLCELAAMQLLLPALLAWRDAWIRRFNRRDSILHRRSEWTFTGSIGRVVSRVPGAVFLVFAAAVFLMLLYAPRVRTESNLMEMETEGLESLLLQQRMVDQFGMAPDGFFLASGSVEESRSLAKRLMELEQVAMVETISDYLPGSEAQQRLQAGIALSAAAAGWGSNDGDWELWELTDRERRELQLSIGFLIDNLRILSRRIGYPGIQALTASLNRIFNDTRRMMDVFQLAVVIYAEYASEQTAGEILTTASLPAALQTYYLSRDGLENLISIYPVDTIWEEDRRISFAEAVMAVDGRAAGIVLAADELTRLTRYDGLQAAVSALLVMFLVLVVDFRNIKLAFLNLVPVTAALASLLGTMALLGIKFDFLNIVAIPLLFGIGIDHAVHVSHRYRAAGRDGMQQVIDKVGRALILGSLLVAIGFFPLVPSPMRSLSSAGVVLALAVGYSLIYSIFLHGALLVIVNDRMRWSIKPWEHFLRRKPRKPFY